MAKLLRVRDYILIASAVIGEFADDLRLVGDIVPKARELRYGFVPPNYKRASYLSTVSKLLSTGEIERKIDENGEPCFEITPKGKEKFKRKFPILSMQKKKWNKEFMVVIFDIEEKKRRERDALRIKLRELGFGMLQESVWVSPYHFEDDFREFLVAYNLQEFVFVLAAKTLGVGNYQNLVEKIWKLEDINKKYAEILEKLESKKADLKSLWDEYFAVAMRDPMLPTELLPKDWCQGEVLERLKNISKGLGKGLALTKS